MADVPPAARRRVLSLTRDLATVWCSEDYLLQAVAQLASLIPGCAATLYTRTRGGEMGEIGHTLTGAAARGWSELPGADELVPQLAQYRLRGQDPWANRAVNTRTLFRGRQAVLEGFRAGVLQPHGLWYQLRAALYEGDEFRLFCCLLRERSAGDFGREEQAMLQAVLPALRDGYLARRALQIAPLAQAQLAAVLDAVDQPAFLVSPGGAVVFENSAARVVFARLPAWVPAAGQQPEASWIDRLARVQRVDLEGQSLYLVLPHQRTAQPGQQADERAPAIDSLPASLRQVAELLARGLTEKEVAQQTGLSLTSVRTYTRRIYRRLGLHSRLELAHLEH